MYKICSYHSSTRDSAKAGLWTVDWTIDWFSRGSTVVYRTQKNFGGGKIGECGKSGAIHQNFPCQYSQNASDLFSLFLIYMFFDLGVNYRLVLHGQTSF